MGKHPEAVNTFRKALTFVPTEWCEPYQELKGSYEAQNLREQAAWAEGMNAFCSGDAAGAKAKLKALVDGQAGVDAMLGLGLMAQVERDVEGVKAWYSKALERDPKNMAAIGALAGLGIAPTPAPEPKKRARKAP